MPAIMDRRDRPDRSGRQEFVQVRCLTNVETIQPKSSVRPACRASSTRAMRFGKSAGLIEFDIDRIVSAKDPRKISARMTALVGTDRYGPIQFRRGRCPPLPGTAARSSPRQGATIPERLFVMLWRPDSFASMINRADGAFARTASTRPTSLSSPPSFNLGLAGDCSPAQPRPSQRAHRD